MLKLNTTGKFALNVVDNLVVVHHQSSQVSLTSAQAFNHMILKCHMMQGRPLLYLVCNACLFAFQTSLIYDIKLRELDANVNVHQPVLPARSINPYKIPLTGEESFSKTLNSFRKRHHFQ